MYMFSKPKVDPKKAAKDASRQTKREIRSSQREIDREIRELERSEREVLLEIKKRAKMLTVDPAKDKGLKSLAKHLVQIRNQKAKMHESKAHLSSVGMQATAMASQVAVSSAIGSVSSAMGTANSAMDTTGVMKMMQEFTKQNEIASIKEEMMDDALVDAFDTDEVEEEAEEVTNQVLAELGLEIGGQMAEAPRINPNKEAEITQEETDALVDALPELRDRLNAL